MANGWTEERRARQSNAIQRWSPWSKATGPRTPEGKLTSSSNAFRGAKRRAARELSKALRDQRDFVEGLDFDR